MGKWYEQLRAEERGTIMAMTLRGESVRAIGETINRAPSTISRERRRNGWKREGERGPIRRPAIAGGLRCQARRLTGAAPRTISLLVATCPPACAGVTLSPWYA